MPFNNGFSTSVLTASNIRNFFNDVVQVIAEVGGSPSGIGLIAVSTSGSNFSGNGQTLSPLYLNDLITVLDVHTNNISASGVVTASNVSVKTNLSSSKITSSFYGDGCKIYNISTSNITNFSANVISKIIPGANLTQSIDSNIKTLSLSSSVTGVLNLESTRISGTSISASQLVIVDENTDDPDFQYYINNFSYPFSAYTKNPDGWFTFAKATGSLTLPYFFGGAFGLTLENSSVLDYANILYLSNNIKNKNNINIIESTTIANNYSENIGIINSSSLLRIADSFYDPGNENRRNNILNNYGILLSPLEVGVKRYPLYLQNKLDSTQELIVDNSGNLGLGNEPKSKLDISGSALITGSLKVTCAVSASQITGSHTGSGVGLYNLTASGISNFTNDVRAQLRAGQNINFTTGTIAFSGVLPIANGGTGLSSSGASANILVSDGTNFASRTLSQDVTINSTGVATVKGLYTNPVRSPVVTPPNPGEYLKWGGTDWFPAPVAATVAVGSLTLTSDSPQTISANGQTVLPTSAYWRLLSSGNYNAGNINYVGATLGQILFIQVPIGQAGSVTFNKGPNLALGSNTRKISSGGSLQLIYDGTRWIEMFFNTSTSV